MALGDGGLSLTRASILASGPAVDQHSLFLVFSQRIKSLECDDDGQQIAAAFSTV